MKRYITIAVLLLPALFACTNDSDKGSDGATGVVLDKEKIDIMVGETAELSATVMPESLKMGVVWSVIDPELAEVSGGTVTGKSEGVTYVVATSEDGNQKAACMVSVNPPVKYTVTVKNEFGVPVTEVYGYPGMKERFYVSTSDGEAHQFTWSLDDDAAGTITSDGEFTLGAVESADASMVYDVQSTVKVFTEDKLGCPVPFRSSLLNGIKLGDEYYPKGIAITVLESERYPLAALYQGADGPLPIPADGINLELSNSTDFSLEVENGSFVLVTGNAANASTKLLASTIGSAVKFELAEFRLEKDFPIRARLIMTSSSTLSFTWTEGEGAAADVSKPYTITLYTDEDCTEEFLSYSIPANDGCWKNEQPRFIFTGLAAGTNYWFKVVETGNDEMYSGPVSATTDEFTIVEVSDDPADVGDVILAEDFSELYWMADEVSQAAGYDVGANDKSTFQDRTVDSFVGYTKSFCSPERIITKQTSAKKASGLRLGKWAGGYTARLYVGPGYVFLGTTKYVTHLVTPSLNNIPEGMSANLTVTVHAAGYKDGGEGILAVQSAGTSFSAIGSGTETNKNKLNLTNNFQTFTYTGGLTNLGEFTVTLEGVKKGERIAFGPTKEDNEVVNTAHMMLISDMTVTITELIED